MISGGKKADYVKLCNKQVKNLNVCWQRGNLTHPTIPKSDLSCTRGTMLLQYEHENTQKPQMSEKDQHIMIYCYVMGMFHIQDKVGGGGFHHDVKPNLVRLSRRRNLRQCCCPAFLFRFVEFRPFYSRRHQKAAHATDCSHTDELTGWKHWIGRFTTMSCCQNQCSAWEFRFYRVLTGSRPPQRVSAKYCMMTLLRLYHDCDFIPILVHVDY